MPKKILLFLCKGFEAYEASVFTDVFGWNNYYGSGGVEVLTAGFQNEIKACWNFTVKPEILYDDINIDKFDALAIPGGFEEEGYYQDAFDERFIQLIQAFHLQKKTIASVCVGAIPLGKSGILINNKATTYDLFENHRRGQLANFGVKVLDKSIVVDNHIITSTGPSTAIDVAFKLLEMLTTQKNMETVSYYMRFKSVL
jgi:4-methyl-5(b-hydroxyethyl)-thiazole monophosphate biosynthesis